ncbi:MAG: helix-turn-helix transcriptional regulator [Dehalococcoidia bacterium]
MNETLGTEPDHLTPTQTRVLALARLGLTNNEIAETIGISRNAVRFHLKNLHASLETGGDRHVLIGSASAQDERFGALIPGFFVPQVAAVIAAVLLSVGSILGIRAIYTLTEDPSQLAVESKLNGDREDLFCLGKMQRTSAGVMEELCFRTEAEALSYLEKVGN